MRRAATIVRCQNHVMRALLPVLAMMIVVVSGDRGTLEDVAWFVQVSDLHISRFAAEQMPLYGDKVADFRAFTERVLKQLKPKILILTGDLVDAKSKNMQGRQYEEEWKVYRELLDNVVSTVGMSELAILDVRGNHDVYDVPKRMGGKDFFAQYAAQGRRNGSAPIHFTLASDVDKLGKCPAALLVGIDVSPEPGLRGPTNFHGIATSEFIKDLDGNLNIVRRNLRAQKCVTPIIAYGHYPLGTIAHPDTRPWWQPDPPASDSTPDSSKDPLVVSLQGMTVQSVLEKNGAQMYLCGHLHALFGSRLHRLHPRSNSSVHLAELEAAAWKDDRRFRLLTVDRGVSSFSDLYFNTPSKVKPELPSDVPNLVTDGYSVSSLEPTQRVGGYIVSITSPPDARYAPLRPALKRGPRTYPLVRALVLPLLDAPGSEKVELAWHCATSNFSGTYKLHRVAEGRPLWEADISTGLECASVGNSTETILTIQVVVSEEGGSASTSERRQVSLLQRTVGTGLLAEPSSPLELPDSTLVGRVIMQAYMPRVAFWLWNIEWAVLLLLLLIPRFLPPRLVAAMEGGPAARLLCWPLLALHRASLVWPLWYSQVLYAVYLGLGPWFLARFQEGQPLGVFWPGRLGLHPPLMTGQNPDGSMLAGYVQFKTADAYLLPIVHMAISVLPGTIWLASVVASWQGSSIAVKRVKCSPAVCLLLVTVHVVAGGYLLWLHSVILRRLWHLYSPEVVLISPGFGWSVPLAIVGLMLGSQRKQLAKED